MSRETGFRVGSRCVITKEALISRGLVEDRSFYTRSVGRVEELDGDIVLVKVSCDGWLGNDNITWTEKHYFYRDELKRYEWLPKKIAVE